MKSLTKLNILAACAFTSLAAFAVDSAPKSVKVNGWVSETACGASHAGKGANPACVAKCIKEGAKPAFVDDAKNNVWTIDNPDAVQGHYGHHIEMQGTEDAATKQVHITKVTMLADQGPGTDKMDMEHK